MKICATGPKAAHRHAFNHSPTREHPASHCADCRPAPHHLTPSCKINPSPAIPTHRALYPQRFFRRNRYRRIDIFHTPITAVRPRSDPSAGLFERGDTVIRRIILNIDGLAGSRACTGRCAKRKSNNAEPAVGRVRPGEFGLGHTTSFISFGSRLANGD